MIGRLEGCADDDAENWKKNPIIKTPVGIPTCRNSYMLTAKTDS